MIARPVVRSKSTRNEKMIRGEERIPLWAALLGAGNVRKAAYNDRWKAKRGVESSENFKDTLDTVKGILTVACEEDIM